MKEWLEGKQWLADEESSRWQSNGPEGDHPFRSKAGYWNTRLPKTAASCPTRTPEAPRVGTGRHAPRESGYPDSRHRNDHSSSMEGGRGREEPGRRGRSEERPTQEEKKRRSRRPEKRESDKEKNPTRSGATWGS
ncbi:hypothetical protein NDU88_002800 [Pleurodeles waltl]|uniref:Uncharacterized protein n=1 Tax=Pleurodeles waltl TaxID=8319 RepID=A0AAV7LDK3_PLEWA|nr:hypothetical protein NDU88_002800 [Pleurodeles waltl]